MRDSGYVAVARRRTTYDALERYAIRLSAAGLKIGLHQHFRTGEVRVFVDGEQLEHQTDARDHWSAFDAIRKLARTNPQTNPTDPMHEALKVRVRGKEWFKTGKVKK
jgi:hypothetical protein